MPASSRKLKRAPKRMARSTRSGSATYAHSACSPSSQQVHALLLNVPRQILD